jgi:CcmD family protein
MKERKPLPSPPLSHGKAIRKSLLFISAFAFSISAIAQGEQTSSGLMRSDLKIYVVAAVLVIIFTGITLFLLSLDRRLKKLEDKNL